MLWPNGQQQGCLIPGADSVIGVITINLVFEWNVVLGAHHTLGVYAGGGQSSGLYAAFLVLSESLKHTCCLPDGVLERPGSF